MGVKFLTVFWSEVRQQKCLEHMQKINLILRVFLLVLFQEKKLLVNNKLKKMILY